MPEKEVKKLATREAFGKVLLELGRVDERIVALNADLSGSTKTSVFAAEFGDRFFNMGIAEADMMGTAAGLAAAGKIPFASTFAMFAAGRAWEQVRQSICLNNMNVKIVASHGGVTVGEDGASHQCLEDFALMRILPNMKVFCPADYYETEKVIESLLTFEGPAYVRLSRAKTKVIFPEENCPFEIGKALVLKEGKDLTIAATGILAPEALGAAEILEAEEGIEARVLNVSTIKPIDEEELAKAARETGAILTVEEHTIYGGFGSAVAEVVASTCPVPLKRVGVPDVFGQSGKPEELLTCYGLDAPSIARSAKELLELKRKLAS